MASYQTKSRKIILAYARRIASHSFSALDMCRYFEEEQVDINQATVYRNLERMVQEGRLLKYKSADQNMSTYQYVEEEEDCHNHLHLRCRRCGRITHLNCGFMQEIEEHLMQEHGFAVLCDGSVIMGLCRDCRVQMAREAGAAKGQEEPES